MRKRYKHKGHQTYSNCMSQDLHLAAQPPKIVQAVSYSFSGRTTSVLHFVVSAVKKKKFKYKKLH